MPWPVSSRCGIELGATPAAFQSASSFFSVPDPSPRETNAPAAAMALICAGRLRVLRMCAGSPAGPRMRKSLCMIRRPPMRSPLCTYAASASGAWTRTASASPLRPISSAAPVPTAMALTSMPVSRLNMGSRESRSPVSWVLVVVANVMSAPCCAQASGENSTAVAAAETVESRSARADLCMTTSVDDLDLGERLALSDAGFPHRT